MENTISNLSFLLVIFGLFFFGHDHDLLVSAQLDTKFYDNKCPNLTKIVRYGVWSAVLNDTRMSASLLRLHFHDCIVGGCEGSVLLDATDTITGEKNALGNRNSLRGFEVIDSIKANVEKACPSTVSCSDILNLAVRDAVLMAGGPFWMVPLGRRDGTTASEDAANAEIPSPFEPLANIVTKFVNKNLNVQDVVVLSGGHTIGFAKCITFKSRLFDFDGSGNPDPTVNPSLLSNLQDICPNQASSDSNLAPLDPVSTLKFDNIYYRNLLNDSGLLQSDQMLMTDNTTASLVQNYATNPRLFRRDFAASMVKLSGVGVLTGQDGQIRTNCRAVN